MQREKRRKNICRSPRKKAPIAKELSNKGIDIELKALPVADYLCSSRVAVEVKTTEDFVSSIIDGRLLQQLNALRTHYEKTSRNNPRNKQHLLNKKRPPQRHQRHDRNHSHRLWNAHNTHQRRSRNRRNPNGNRKTRTRQKPRRHPNTQPKTSIPQRTSRIRSSGTSRRRSNHIPNLF